MSRLMVSGVSGVVCMGMSGHFSAKHLGCQDSPQLCTLRTRHSRPTKSWLQTVHVALVWGAFRGCMVVYVRVGTTMLRRCRLALAWGVSRVAGGRVEGGAWV